MPAIDVTAPNGRTYQLNTPEGATKEQIEQKVQEFGRAMAADPYGTHEKLYGLPPGLLKATAQVESGPERADKLDPSAVSPTGVRGLMQITKATGKRYGLTPKNFTDPLAQIDAAAQLHRDNLKAAKGDLRAAVARYGDPKETGYADKVLSRMGQGAGAPPGGSPAAPQARIAPMAEDPMAGVHNPLKVAASRVGNIVADYNAVLHHWGYRESLADTRDWMAAHHIPGHDLVDFIHQISLGRDPAELKAAFVKLGLPGAGGLRTTEPTGVLEQAAAALGPLTLLSPTLLAAGTIGQAITGQHETGDAVEAIVGGVQAIRQVSGAVSAFREITTRQGEARAGAKTAAQVFDELRTMRNEAARAEMAYAVAAGGRRQAAWQALKAGVRGGDRPFAGMESPEQELARVTGLARGADVPSPLEVGREMKAIGGQRLEVPGTEVGLRSEKGMAAGATKRIFRHAELASDTANLEFDPESAGTLQLRQQVKALTDRMSGSRAEDIIAARESGSRVTAEAPARLFGKGLSADERAVLDELARVGEEPITGRGGEVIQRAGSTKLSDLMRLYGKVGRAAQNPGLYPTLTSDAKNAFSDIKNSLRGVIDTEVARDDKAAKLWDSGLKHVREVREPLRQTAEAVLGTGRPHTELEAIKTGLLGDPRRLMVQFQHAGPAWALRMRQGAFGQILREAKGDMPKALAMWRGLEPETQQMLAAPATPRSAKALADILRVGKPIHQAQAVWARDLRKAAPDLQVGVDQITRTLEVMAKKAYLYKDVGMRGAFASYHLLRGTMMSFVNPAFATYHFGTFVLMTKPGMIRTLLSVPVGSVRWTQTAAAVEGMLQKKVEMDRAEQGAGQGSGPVLQPGQRLPAPAAGEAAAAVQTQPAAGGGSVVSPAP